MGTEHRYIRPKPEYEDLAGFLPYEAMNKNECELIAEYMKDVRNDVKYNLELHRKDFGKVFEACSHSPGLNSSGVESAGLQQQQPPRGGTWVGSTCDVLISSSLQSAGLQKQQPPRGGTWVGSTCRTSKSFEKQVVSSEWLRTSRLFQNPLSLIPMQLF
ncbi:hypothetical protein HZH66_006232 [Vespula vulgaris]|uniref:Uncharacterized protein n=1 Tax=Vespula vulgaris TaxID=7454 RepID=A0A834K1X1_VESVU|nr:hypothetical protein HZH66_006232 [Vespula vulgaris]